MLCAVGFASGQALELDDYRGSQPVMVVFSRSRDDVRPFSFNLAISNNWNRLTARNIAVLDVDSVRYNVDAVAEQLELGDLEFAVVMVARDGTTVMTTPDDDRLDELLAALDLHDGEDRQ